MNYSHKIKRRNLLKTITKGYFGALAFGSASAISTGCGQKKEDKPTPKKKVQMKIGCQHGGTGKKNLEFLARHGVYNMDGGSPEFIEGIGWDLEDSLAKKEAYEKAEVERQILLIKAQDYGLSPHPKTGIPKLEAMIEDYEALQALKKEALALGIDPSDDVGFAELSALVEEKKAEDESDS